MKKILSLGVAAAMMALSAVAASAETTIAQTAAEDTTVTFEISIAGTTARNAEGTIKLGEGLTLVSIDKGSIADAIITVSAETGKYGVITTADAIGDGVIATVVATVTDVDTATISIEGAKEGEDVTVTPVTADLDNVEPISSSEEPTTTTTSTEPVTTTTTTDSSTTTEEAGNTGVALAVVPAIIAGAALIVSKKRK